ncbi:Zinc knuckle family protein [Heracleum sosnowskyi]|uniref:Zinc knuckle family protein n=1 Tax=Heracleum sosnowskyi TaxID=360622 RepID=A0AAD8J3H9_9APIA|nr:Zinc knuckle family protein [Heracleum sosnowskyi]
MTEDYRDMKLGLPLSYPNPSVRTRMETSSGAGVNADSRIDTTLVEHRTENIPSYLWDAGPSNMTLAHDSKSIGDQKITKLQIELTVNSEAGPLCESSRAHHSGMSGAMVKANPVVEDYAVHFNKKQDCNYEEKAFFCRNDVQSEDIATRSKTDAGRRNKNTMDALPLLEYKTKDISSSRIEDVASGTQMLDIKARGLENAPIEGLEFSAENEVHVIENNACGQSEKGSRVESSYPVEVVGTLKENKSNMLQEKGKQIILFGKNINENISKSEDDSHDSVESSNSATLSSKGKKRGNFEKELIVGSKRIKSLPQEAPTLTSPIKPDSSFVNWISNMVKGLAKANKDEGPLALGLGHPRYGLDCDDQRNQACNKIQDPGGGHMGFQSMFRSLYCPKTIDTVRRPNDNPSVSGANERMESQKSFINVMPISFYRENDESCNKLLIDKNNSDHHKSGGNGGDLSIQTSSQPRMLSANNDSTPETSKTKSTEKKSSTTLTCSNKKEALRSTDTCLDKQKTLSFEDKSLHIPSEGQVMPNIFPKNDLSRSLWITRFSSRTSTPALDSDHCNSAEIKLEDSSELVKHIPLNHANSSFSRKNSEAAESFTENPINASGKDKLKYPTNVEDSIGFNRVVKHNHKKSLCRTDSPPPTYKSLEPMASAFARRLEVLKSIPSVTQDDPTPFRIKCLYCGRSGHGLVSCPEVQKSELVDLMKNISSNDAAKGSDHWCIKCLQLGHLAISCSVASTSRQQQSHKNAPIHNYRTADTVQIYKSGEPYSSMLFTKESYCKLPSDHSSSSQKVHKTLGSERIVSFRDDVPSCYKELEVKENQVPPLCRSASKPIPCDALNIFEAVRKLHLSRMDILKWMNSNRPLVHLNGFFLRLRLRKWEMKLGGTGYYVACINELHREVMLRSSEKSIYVSVGDIRCSVESQYISNHNFSEDELMTWWHTITKNGEIPALNDLRTKFEEKHKLGL